MPDLDVRDAFERFRNGDPLMVPAGPDAARRVSNRRQRVRIAAASAAAVIAIATPAIAYTLVSGDSIPDIGSSSTPTGSATFTTTPSPSAAPDVEPTDVPATATLQQSDVPAGYQYEGDEVGGDWTLEFAGQFCAPPDNLGGVPSARASRAASFRTGSGPESRAIVQRVDRYSVAEAQAYLQAVATMARGCEPAGGDPMTWTIVHEGFAGDDSLVLRWEGADIANTYVVVRVGGLVTQIWYKDTDTPDPVQLGQHAATRLCEGTTAC